MEGIDSHLSWHEFNMPYQRLVDTICSSELPAILERPTIEQVQTIKAIVEDIVTREALTGTLNALGAKWYLDPARVQSVALTDMLDMHEGNARYGSVAIDQDLKRFANLLLRHFPKEEGFLLFRSERAGDEFRIVSTENNSTELESRIRSVWKNDLGRGLLAWNYGVGRDDGDAHVELYRNRVKDLESMEVSVSNGQSTFIIVRPESDDYSALFKLSADTARVIAGSPIMDLHLTVQSIRNVHDFAALRERLEEYSAKLDPFEIHVKNIVRMNVNNQQGRLWLLAEKTKTLEKLYTDLGDIAREIGCESYPYRFENWLPHIKIVDLPEKKSTQIKDPTFGANRQATFTVRRLEWTVQKAPERWELLQQFSFPQ
jgi:GGDEF domain-containing protein